MTQAFPPLVKTITVPWPQSEAFGRFTQRMSSWWPLRSHSVGGERAERVEFEGRVGGRIREIVSGGEEHVWGTVTHWEPPTRVAFTWHPGDTPDKATEVDVRFNLGAGRRGTEVVLTHTKWERLGALARKARRGYPIGWAYVLRLYAGRTASPLVLALGGLMWAIRVVQGYKQAR